MITENNARYPIIKNMQQWVNKLDDFLRFNEKEVLQHKGKVSRQDTEAKVRQELQRHYEQQKGLAIGDG